MYPKWVPAPLINDPIDNDRLHETYRKKQSRLTKERHSNCMHDDPAQKNNFKYTTLSTERQELFRV